MSLQLRDERGVAITPAEVLRGRPGVLLFDYLTCPNLCGLALNGTVAAVKGDGLLPGRDLELIAISIDPRDTPADAARARSLYAAQIDDPRAASGLHFLSGSPAAIRKIADAAGFPYRYDEAIGEFAHPAGLVLVTPQGRVSSYLHGIRPEPGALRQGLESAVLEKTSSSLHPLLLLCFGYDPQPGTIAARVMNALKWVAAAAIIACLLLIVRLARRKS